MKYIFFCSFLLLLNCMFLCNFKSENHHKHKAANDTTIFYKNNGNKYILDKTRTIIKAIDKNGKLLWKTNPYKDSFLEAYRVNSPIIKMFALGKNNQIDVIFISYNNSVFGYLNMSNGKFYYQGRD